MLGIPSVAFVSDDYYPRVYPVPPRYDGDPFTSEDVKWKVLAEIGITPEFHLDEEDTGPLAAWRNAVADLNHHERSALRGNLDLGFTPEYVRRFVWYLA
jgi:hypothetical protein